MMSQAHGMDGNVQLSRPPHATFHRLIDGARLPQRADRSAAGTLPTRASRYCDAVTTAASFGWWLFPPIDFSLLWDGEDIHWTWGDRDWLPLSAAQFPDFAGAFDAAVPPSVRGCSPPFLTALPEPGLVQVWSGLIARTAPDWSLLIRPLANLPHRGGYALYEGIVETDQWFGPLFTNLRLTRTHAPVRFERDFPFAQVQPLPRIAYAEATLDAVTCVPHLSELTAGDWDDYARSVVQPNGDPDRPHGQYAVTARRRRKAMCPVAAPTSRAAPALTGCFESRTL